MQSKSFAHVLKIHGKKPVYNADGVIQVVGVTAKENLHRLKKEHGISIHVDTLLTQKQKAYEKLLRANLKPQKGLVQLIKRLKAAGMKLALASSSSKKNIGIVLQGLGVKKYFPVVISGETLVRSKPDPEIFLKAAKALRVLPSECVVLEDAHSGVLAGYRAGMQVIAVPNKFTRSHDFDKARLVVPSLNKISPKIIGVLGK